MNRALRVALAAACALVACSTPRRADRNAPLPGPIAVEARSLSGAVADDGSQSPERLLARVESWVSEGQPRLAERLAARNADLAWRAMLDPQNWSKPGVRALARALDASPAFAGRCTKLLDALAADPAAASRYVKQREATLASMRAGDFDPRVARAMLDAIPASPDAAPLVLDARRIAGLVQMLGGDSAAAAETFAAGADAAGEFDFARAHLALLASCAFERAERSDKASASWTLAVTSAARAASSSEFLRDPEFWERALNARPPSVAWPDTALAELARRAERSLGFASSVETARGSAEGLAWSVVGAERLERGEARAATLAFTRAEALLPDAAARSAARLGQARALARNGETDAAAAVLTTLVADANPEISSAALAWLGALELQRGRVELARELLERALAFEAAWPDRAGAEANLALALLRLGETERGLATLRSAREQLAAARDLEQWVQCVRNEQRYFESQRDAGQVALLEATLRAGPAPRQ